MKYKVTLEYIEVEKGVHNSRDKTLINRHLDRFTFTLSTKCLLQVRTISIYMQTTG